MVCSTAMSAFGLIGLLSPLVLATSENLPSYESKIKTVYQFSDPTWLENIAVRANGEILVTKMQPETQLWQISSSSSKIDKNNTKLVHEFQEVNSILGITETDEDVFVVVGVNTSAATVAIPETAKAWKVDFTSKKGSVNVAKIADFPDALFVNGAATLPHNKNLVLVADSTLGCVWRLNTVSGKVDQVLKYPEMAPVPNQIWNIGINGIHTRGDYVYWTNSFQVTVYRLRIDPRNGEAAPGATVEKVWTADDASFIDDFAIDASGGIYSPAGINNTIVYGPARSQHAHAILGSAGSFDVAGGTSLAFARNGHNGSTDFDTLYVATSGGLGAPVNGTATEGGKVVAYRIHSN